MSCRMYVIPSPTRFSLWISLPKKGSRRISVSANFTIEKYNDFECVKWPNSFMNGQIRMDDEIIIKSSKKLNFRDLQTFEIYLLKLNVP